jgi:hypothetical protein
MSRVRVLIIGGGPTGAYLASLLSRVPSLCASSALWEKSTNAGRFSSHVSRFGSPPSVTDLGAQYFSLPAGGCAATAAALAELRGAGVIGAPLPRGSISGLRPPHDGGEHYAGGAAGAAGVVRHWLAAAAAGGCAVAHGTRLVALEAAPGGGGGWLARGEGAGGAPVALAADAVVLAVPLPQALGVGGDAARALEASGVADALRAVTYSSRAVLVLTFAAESRGWWEARLPWAGRFVGAGDAGGGAVRYVAQSARMRALGGGGGVAAGGDAAGGGAAGGSAGAPVAFLFHSTVALGDTAVAAGGGAVGGGEAGDAWRRALRDAALAVLEAAAGGGPPSPPVAERFHVWKYSQLTSAPAAAVAGARGGVEVRAAPGGGGGALLLRRAAGEGALNCPPLLLAGDGFTESNIGGCVRSALAANALLASALGLAASGE